MSQVLKEKVFLIVTVFRIFPHQVQVQCNLFLNHAAVHDKCFQFSLQCIKSHNEFKKRKTGVTWVLTQLTDPSLCLIKQHWPLFTHSSSPDLFSHWMALISFGPCFREFVNPYGYLPSVRTISSYPFLFEKLDSLNHFAIFYELSVYIALEEDCFIISAD